jgi:ZIP family zinc transporter
VSSGGLLVGALAGSISRLSHHAIALGISVGAGLLLGAMSLKVAADAMRIAGPVAAALSLLLGAAVFSGSNALLARSGAGHRTRCGDCVEQPGRGLAIALGTVLYAIPEAMVLGIELRGPATAIAVGAAVAMAAGYVGLGALGEVWPPRRQAFGAGALLAMTAETMIPEAIHNSPRFSGLLAASGFGFLLLVDVTTR